MSEELENSVREMLKAETWTRAGITNFTKNNIEELMINDDGEEKNIIYGNVGEDGKITNMIIYNDDNEEVDVVCIWGTFEIKGKEDKRSHKGNSKSALPGVTIPSETIVIPDSTSNSVTVK